MNFPVQIKLLPTNAPYLNGADLLIAADCTAYAYGNFHQDFIRGKVTMIGCPKLDAVSYAEKLTEIFRNNDIRSITVTRMTVPCCGGLSFAVKTAIEQSGKKIPLNIETISPDGKIIRQGSLIVLPHTSPPSSSRFRGALTDRDAQDQILSVS